MIGAFIVGVFAAGWVAVALFVAQLVQHFVPGTALALPALILGVSVIPVLFRRTGLYDGVADLLVHIHSTGPPDVPARWGFRGIISLLLSAVRAPVGIEGAAIEFGEGLLIRMRARSAHRFEQRRRTDTAVALAAGLSAAFGAPLAAILVPIELGIGGKSLPPVVAALSAFVASHYLLATWNSGVFEPAGILTSYQHLHSIDFLAALVIGALAGVLGICLIRFSRAVRENLLHLFQRQAWVRALMGGVLLSAVALVYRPGEVAPHVLIERILWLPHASRETVLVLGAQFLGLVVVLAGFGTAGIFWPSLALGALLGATVDFGLFQSVPGFLPVACLVGGAGLWGALLGTPVASAVLIFEVTRNFPLFILCMIASWTGLLVRRYLKSPSLVDSNLNSRGLALLGGRSAAILEAILVKEAMVNDHECIHEHEPVTAIHQRLLQSRYPFLPVVNTQGHYTGLLTVDMVQEAFEQDQGSHGKSGPAGVVRLLEAKDLLYRTGFRAATVRPNDRLSVPAGLFGDIPCIPVLSEDGRVAGLLFAYSVRLAYDREMARRSLAVNPV